MPLLRTEQHEGGGVMVGTKAADRFTIRLKDGDDFPTCLRQKLKERAPPPIPEQQPQFKSNREKRDFYGQKWRDEHEEKRVGIVRYTVYPARACRGPRTAPREP